MPSTRIISKSISAGQVLVICPGGLENGGGIGRQMGYFLSAKDDEQPTLSYRVLDSRGPWFLGASRLHSLLSGLYLSRCLGGLLFARLMARPCLVHINVTGRGSTLRKLVVAGTATILGLPYILHVHDYDYAADFRGRSRFMQDRVQRLFRRARNVLVLGHRDRSTLSDLFQLIPGQAVVLHNAVPDPLDGGLRVARNEPCHILFLGYLSARKGVPELLQALASAELASGPWRATLAGSGPIDAYRAEAARLGVADRISFPGWLDQGAASAMCADADMLVLPSHAEGLAMAVLEGLSHGLAVVTTAVGAHNEVIEPEISGILVPPGDVAALAAALKRVIDDDGLRTRLQHGARARYLAGFDIRGYCARLLQLHEGLLSGVGSRQSAGASRQAALR